MGSRVWLTDCFQLTGTCENIDFPPASHISSITMSLDWMRATRQGKLSLKVRCRPQDFFLGSLIDIIFSETRAMVHLVSDICGCTQCLYISNTTIRTTRGWIIGLLQQLATCSRWFLNTGSTQCLKVKSKKRWKVQFYPWRASFFATWWFNITH